MGSACGIFIQDFDPGIGPRTNIFVALRAYASLKRRHEFKLPPQSDISVGNKAASKTTSLLIINLLGRLAASWACPHSSLAGLGILRRLLPLR